MEWSKVWIFVSWLVSRGNGVLVYAALYCIMLDCLLFIHFVVCSYTLPISLLIMTNMNILLPDWNWRLKLSVVLITYTAVRKWKINGLRYVSHLCRIHILKIITLWKVLWVLPLILTRSVNLLISSRATWKRWNQGMLVPRRKESCMATANTSFLGTTYIAFCVLWAVGRLAQLGLA
jgi:hypothetical protein